MLYAPLADTRLVAAGCVLPPYAAEPNRRERVSRRGPRRGSGAGLDAGASGDYRAWPCKDGKPQRPEAGQGSGPRAPPTREASPAMGSLPQRPASRRTQPGQRPTPASREERPLPPRGRRDGATLRDAWSRPRTSARPEEPQPSIEGESWKEGEGVERDVGAGRGHKKTAAQRLSATVVYRHSPGKGAQGRCLVGAGLRRGEVMR